VKLARALIALLVVMAAGLIPVLVRAQSARSDADEAYGRGITLLASGGHREALPHLDEAIRLDPRHADAYREAIRIDPRFAWAYAGRGVSLLYLRRDAKAETAFKKAFDLDPTLRKGFESLINKAKAKRSPRPEKQ